MGMQKIRFKKGNRKMVREVTAFELGSYMEKGWEIDEILEILGEGW